MSVYLIAQINIHDKTAYSQYEAGFMEIFTKYQGEMLAVDETAETLEGTWPYTRTVLIRFPSEDAAHAWYDSAEYQTLMQHRLAGSTANIAMVKGFSANQ